MNIPIIIISLEKDIERLNRLIKRLEFHGLTNFKVLKARPYKTPDINFENFINGIQLTDQGMKYAAISFDHLRAIKMLFDDKTVKEGLIFEDDIMLHKDFVKKLNEHLNIIPEYTDCLLFSPYISTRSDTIEHKMSDELFSIKPGIWSASCYWLNRKYAKRILRIYDRPLIEHPIGEVTQFSPENWILESKGFYSLPPLAVEECVESNTNQIITGKRTYWNQYDYNNYQIQNEKISDLW
jgi:GR25 family glycosyltransferase involved in LPS biosynthesis